MKRTATQRSAECALIRLDPLHPCNTASAEVRAALSDPTLRRYLDSWVNDHLRYAAGYAEEYYGQRADLQRDANRKAQS